MRLMPPSAGIPGRLDAKQPGRLSKGLGLAESSLGGAALMRVYTPTTPCTSLLSDPQGIDICQP
jgi:hypothetical protein